MRFRLFPTILCALILSLGLALVAFTSLRVSPVYGITSPARSLALVAGRTMELRQACRRIPAWERQFYQIYDSTVGSNQEISDLLAWHRELAPLTLDPIVAAHLGILEGETAQFDPLREQTHLWTAQAGEPLRSLASLIQNAYLDVPLKNHPEEVLDFVEETLPPGWFRNRLEERLARKIRDLPKISAIQYSEVDRFRRLLWRYRWMTGLDMAILLAFAWALLPFLRHPASFWRFGTASLPPRWRGAVGVTVLIRGFALGILLSFVPGLVVRGSDAAVNLTAYLLWSLPILFLAKRHLCNPDRLRLRDELGIIVAPTVWKKLALIVLVGLGIDSLGSWFLGRAGVLFRLPNHWAESFEPDLVWGSPWTAGVSLLGMILLGPWIEELVFRGLIFGTLRRRYRWVPSALLSAGLFAFVHGYGLLGFVSVLWSGVVYAWIYEKSGSLVPGFVVHALGNLLFCLNLIVMYRLP